MSDAQAGPLVLLDPLPKILQLRSLNLLAGASGIGKTALLSWLVRQFELGAPIFGHATNPPPAIGYLTADRSWEGNNHWFAASGVQTMRAYSLIDDLTLKLPNQRMKHLRVEFFKQCVARLELPPGSLLIVDPIALFLGGNLLDYDTVGFACIEIQRWLRQPEQQHAVVGICHSAKQKSDKNDRYLRLQDRISGSMAQLGYTSTQMFLAGPDETGDKDGNYTFLWNPHTAPAETFQFQKGDTGLFLTDHAVPINAAGRPLASTRQALTEFETEILGHFPHEGGIPTRKLIVLYADGGETARKRITRALGVLETLGHIFQVRHGYWARRDATLTLLETTTPSGESSH